MYWLRKAVTRPSFFYVISHERSGTHFSINCIKLNAASDLKYKPIGEWFGPFDQPQTQFKHIQEKMRSLHPKNHYILKSHCDKALFQKCYPKGKIIYIVRDCRDALVSYFHFLKESYIDWFRKYHPKTPAVWFTDFSDFIRQPVPEFLRWNYSLKGDFSTPIDRWMNHVSPWIEAPSQNMKIITYHQLHTQTETTTRELLAFLDLPAQDTFTHPTFDNAYTVVPRKGVVGDWQTHFSADDLAFLARKLEGSPALRVLDLSSPAS